MSLLPMDGVMRHAMLDAAAASNRASDELRSAGASLAPTNVLQVSKFYKPVMGGIEKVAWELAEGLARLHIRSDVLCSNHLPVTSREQFPSGYQVVRASSWGRMLSTSVAPAMLPSMRALARGRDVIHLHMPDPMAALALWSARPEAPVVVHWHSDVIRQRHAMKLYEPLQRWVLSRADAIIATSQPYADASLPLRPWLHKISVIPIGVSDRWSAQRSPAAEALRQRFGGRRIVFALGRMAYYKGFDVLIKAAAALPDDVVVVIGGEGEMFDCHRAQVAREGLSDKVRLIGHIPDDALFDYFQASELFCLSSTVRAEAYGVVMIEAMMMGKAVIAADIVGSGVPWVNVHGVTGFNVPVGQPAELARVLSATLADQPLCLRLGQAARARYLREFSADLMTRRIAALYSRLHSTR